MLKRTNCEKLPKVSKQEACLSLNAAVQSYKTEKARTGLHDV